jgi:hypothetical protein
MTDRTPEVLDNDENSPGGLRATIDRLNETIESKDSELDGLRTEKRGRVLDDSGLKGPALKAVTKDLERGDYTGEVTADGLREYAKEEYEWEPPSDDDKPAPDETVDDDARKRMESQQARDDLAAASHARGDGEENPESQQAAQDTKLDEGDVQGAIYDELKAKVSRTT